MLNVLSYRTKSRCTKISDYEHDRFSQAYGEIFSCFRHLTGDKTLQPYITRNDSRTSTNYPAIDRPRYNLYVFDISYHQGFGTSQPLAVNFEFSPPVDAGVELIVKNLLLTTKIISNSRDGQRGYESIYV